jgi:hypothetical protein
MSNEIDDLDFNILDEAVNEKSYTKPNISISAKELNAPLDEPSFMPPPISADEPNPQKETPEQIRAKKNPEPVNQEMKYLPKKEQAMAAEQMADLILAGYGKMHDFGNAGLQIDFKNLNKMQKEGKINLNAMVEYDIGVEMPARDFFGSYNKQMEGFFKLEQEFVDDVKPVLTRVLAKKGIGATDENYLLFKIAEDAGTKAFMFIQQKRSIADMLSVIGKATVRPDANPAPPPPPPQPQQQQPTPQPQEPQPQQNDEVIIPSYQEAEVVNGKSSSVSISPDSIMLPSKSNGSGRRGRKPKI